MMLRAVLPALLFAAGSAFSAPPELSGRVAAERPAGCAEYGFFFFSLYRAELWTDAAAPPGPNFGLTLHYRRGFSHDELVSTSIREMVRISGRSDENFDAAMAELSQAMRNVTEGDRITAWREGPDRIAFFHNGLPAGELTSDAGLFLDIWLGPESLDPKRRDALLSGRCDD